MLDDYNYVYKKEVDWSVLHQGVSIPITIQIVFQNSIKRFLLRGESKDINLVLEGKNYKARLVNQKFDELKYPNHKDILQIRYHPQSDIAEKLRQIFSASYNFISTKRNSNTENQRKIVRMPKECREFLAIYTTVYEDTYWLECVTEADTNSIKNVLKYEDEKVFEDSVNYILSDSDARIEDIQQLTKVRRLNRAIGDSLKMFYDYKCQICNDNFGAKYEAEIVEAHHINPFVKSLDNDAANQIIICPNHHRVIHKVNPIFDRRRLTFNFGNGVVEKISLNSHL